MVFTGRFGHKDVEVLFDRICRKNGIDHLLTAPRSPTTTGKIERFHRTLRQEFLTGRIFDDLGAAQADLEDWVGSYNTHRPHQALGMSRAFEDAIEREPLLELSRRIDIELLGMPSAIWQLTRR